MPHRAWYDAQLAMHRHLLHQHEALAASPTAPSFQKETGVVYARARRALILELEQCLSEEHGRQTPPIDAYGETFRAE